MFWLLLGVWIWAGLGYLARGDTALVKKWMFWRMVVIALVFWPVFLPGELIDSFRNRKLAKAEVKALTERYERKFTRVVTPEEHAANELTREAQALGLYEDAKKPKRMLPIPSPFKEDEPA